MENSDALVVGATEKDIDGNLYQLLWVTPDIVEYKRYLIEHDALNSVITLIDGTIKDLQSTLNYLQKA